MQNKPTKEGGGRGGRGARLTEREGTERHGCGHCPKARPLGSMHGDDDGGGRGGGGDAPRATLQHIPDDEVMMKHRKPFGASWGQAVKFRPTLWRWRLTRTVTALAVGWFIRIDRESCIAPSNSQNRHFEPPPKALPQLSVRWRRPVRRPYAGPSRLTRHGFVLRGHALGT